MSSDYTSNEQTTTTNYESTTRSTDSGVLDMQYVKGIPGILKYVELLCSLIGFICVVAPFVYCLAAPSVGSYFEFITMACFITSLILYFLRLFKLQKRIFRCDCIFWPLIELVYYIIILIMLFFGDLFLSIYACVASFQAGVAFGWLAFFAYCVDLVFVIRDFLKTRKDRAQASGGGTSSPDQSNRY